MHFSFAQKLKSTFVPKKRATLVVKSTMAPPLRNGTLSVNRSSPDESDSDPELTEKEEIDQYEITDSYYDGYVSPIDRALVKVVNAAGSVWTFVGMVFTLILWTILGIVYKAPQVWQIVMQDGQAIQTYAWDTLLMRQQLDDSDSTLKLFGRMKSRYFTHKRILQSLKDAPLPRKTVEVSEKTVDAANAPDDEADLQSNNWFDKLCTFCSTCLGSLPSFIIYWIGIFIWIGCGTIKGPTGNTPPYTRWNPQYAAWSDNWQMYINTATAVELVITSVLLDNVRARNDKYVHEQIEIVSNLDCRIEGMGRYLTGDQEDNTTVKVPQVKLNRVENIISWYAEIIGTGIGLLLSIAVFTAWVACGDMMHWDSNWWLIIGTYCGLAGFIDGFVLREVYRSITGYEQKRFAELLDESQELLDLAGIHHELKRPVKSKTLSYRISAAMNNFCSNEWTTIGSVVMTIALLAVATVLHWNITAQLIANTPGMIIEGFCLLVLIQAHNMADYERRFVTKQLAISRRLLFEHVSSMQGQK